MKRIIILFVILLAALLLITSVAGCWQQPEGNSGPLTLQIASPSDGRETSWGFATVDGVVSPPEAVVTVNGVTVKVDENGSFESDYILLDEGTNELRTVATLDGKKISKTVTVTYIFKLHVSISLNLEPGKDWFTESPAEIGGRVSDPRAEVIVNGKKAEVGRDGHISVMLELAEGQNSLTATARLGEQTDSDTREAIYVTPVSLNLDIEAPQDGHETQVDIVKITGAVSDPEARVLVNNVPALVTAAGAFSTYIELDEGENRIDAVAVRGSESVVDTIHVTYRHPSATTAEKPKLNIISPHDNAEFKVNLLPVTGTVSDAEATVLVNGIEAAVAVDGSFQGYAVLAEGENSIGVTALKGEVKTAKNIKVTFTPALVVYLEHPFPAMGVDYTKEPMVVTGKVNKLEARVTVNGKDTTVAADRSFTVQVQLKEGSNSIKAVATLGDERDEVYISFMVSETGFLSPVPGYSHFFAASLEYEHEITLSTGEIKRLGLTLETRKDGPGRFYGRLFHVDREYGLMPQPMPGGLDAYLEPPEFIAYPNATYHFNLVFGTTLELDPGTYYLHFYHTFETGFYGSGWIEIKLNP